MDESLLLRWRRGRAGELEARECAELERDVDALFAAHEGRVYAQCYRRVRDEQRARELAQDVLLIAYQKLDDYEGRSQFSTWLYGIARNVCMRAMERRQDLLAEDDLLDPADPARTVLRHLLAHERERVVMDAMSTLGPEEQEAVYLRYVQELPYEEIDRLMNLDTRSGARGLLQRCSRHLKQELPRRIQALGHGSSFIRTAAT
jgi:RNA polymerase sigma-70 factor (ECF subfamily)